MQKILVIDDDLDIRGTIKSLLEANEYHVDTSTSAKEADKKIRTTAYSTILLDIFLPDINGLDYIDELRSKGIKVPVIIITGDSNISTARQAIRQGVFDYMVKPFKSNQLLQVVQNAVMHNHLIEERESLERQKQLYQAELEHTVARKVKELRESEQKYQDLVEQSLVGVYILQKEKFKYVNHKFCEILGLNPEDIIEKKGLSDFATAEFNKIVKHNLELRSKGNIPLNSFQFRAVTNDNKILLLETWVGPVLYKGSNAMEGIIIDITEQYYAKVRENKLELELLNENKLAAIGQLAAGIAHNLNTPLSIIQGNAELLQFKYSDAIEIEKILKQTENMSHLINTILVKNQREQQNEIVDIDINELLTQELEFLKAHMFFKHKIEKTYHFDDSLPRVEGIYSDFSQSISSIIQNAIDAMYDTEKKELSVSTTKENGMIVISISDTGVGIPEKNRQRIFEPFFSTNHRDIQTINKQTPSDHPKGTGLGLSVALNLLSPYGARIEFTSEVNKGTTFFIKIPIRK
ncbi:MAG: response regulator [Calditrichaceae bacterium]|nr:response regulator [Calditrichaceae bacterium]RQV97638.1 MAG: response regulator [Calditrichota bacterium]